MTKSRGIGRHPPSQRTHGHSFVSGRATAEYNAWSSMKWRCNNPKSQQYKWYGARGITVCERWNNSFSAFLEDMGPRPSADHSLDRIDVNGNYDPRNCRWATDFEQSSNRRTARHIEINGVSMCLSEAARLTGIPRTTLSRRLATGWPLERAVRP